MTTTTTTTSNERTKQQKESKKKRIRSLKDLFKHTGARIPHQVVSTATFYVADKIGARIQASIIGVKTLRRQLKKEYKQLVYDKNIDVLQKYIDLHDESKSRWKNEYCKWIVDSGLNTPEEALWMHV